MNLPAIQPEQHAALMDRVIIKGDLATLDPKQRVEYYNAVCNSAGLNPLTRPFEYLVLNGKTVLYARKDATDQLRKKWGVSVTDMSQVLQDGVLVVTVKVQDAQGRTDIAKGALSLGNLKGDALANAYMKAETKAKRRATLSICGLGMLDEVELETIPEARVLKKDHRADYHTILRELDECLDARGINEWFSANQDRVSVLPNDWRNSIMHVIDTKVDWFKDGSQPPAAGEILSDQWSDQQAGNLRNAMSAHKTEEPTELWTEPEDGTPPEWDSKWDALGPVKQAGILCADPSFWKYLNVRGAEEAAAFVRERCDVTSRKDLSTDTHAAGLWRRMVAEYRAWQREPEIVPSSQSRGAAVDSAGPSLEPGGGPADEKTAVDWDIELGEAAKQGSTELKRVWDSMPLEHKRTCEVALRRRHQPTAAQADKAGAQA